MNHLLKSPFCVHPKTGNVAVPLNTDKIHEFDVTSAPRIEYEFLNWIEENWTNFSKLIKELNENNSNAMETDENAQSQPGKLLKKKNYRKIIRVRSYIVWYRVNVKCRAARSRKFRLQTNVSRPFRRKLRTICRQRCCEWEMTFFYFYLVCFIFSHFINSFVCVFN